jgi:hypothetical protein
VSDTLLEALPDRDFRVYCVWVPVLLADNEAAAAYNEISMKRRRLRHYWDSQQLLAKHLAKQLGIPLAWDVYCLYPRGDMELEKPAFWMHQLDTDFAPRLDVGVLRDKALELHHSA